MKKMENHFEEMDGTRYFMFRGEPEKNFPVKEVDGKFHVLNNRLNRIVFSGTFEECQKWNSERLFGGIGALPHCH
ncbi:MAG: hypothetical protein Q4B26_11085 [Eubacteriales bacterium]|nr:hypothetical protein [Eubacteriales bacterium]